MHNMVIFTVLRHIATPTTATHRQGMRYKKRIVCVPLQQMPTGCVQRGVYPHVKLVDRTVAGKEPEWMERCDVAVLTLDWEKM